MFCWPCIIVYQYNETNVLHFWFSLLRIKGLYMFRELLVHPQEALYKQHLVYCVRIMSVGCATIAVKLQSWHSQLTYARNIPSAVCVTPPEDELRMLETCKGPWFSINWMKGASRWFHYTDTKEPPLCPSPEPYQSSPRFQWTPGREILMWSFSAIYTKCIFLLGFSTKNLYAPLFPPYVPHASPFSALPSAIILPFDAQLSIVDAESALK
jgi:hypothetical protein